MISVLHVDDDLDQQFLLAKNLDYISSTIEIQAADSAPAALQLLESNTFDCILCDYQMPGMNGLEFLMSLHARDINIPFIFLTGQGNEKLAVDALRAGADDYFTKDKDLAHFERIAHSIAKHVEANHQRLKRKEAEETLTRSENKFAKAFNVGPDPITISRAKDGKVLSVNDDFFRVFKYTKEDVIGNTAAEIDFWSDMEDRAAFSKLVSEQGFVRNFDAKLRKKTGEIVKCRVSCESLELEGELHFLSSLKDISEQEEISRLRNEQKSQWDSVIENIPAGVAITSLNGEILLYNNEIYRKFGYSKAEIQQMNVSSFWALPEKRAVVLGMIREDGVVKNYETEFVRKDSSVFPANINVSPVNYQGKSALLAIIEDITDRKHAEEELINKQSFLDSLVEQSPFPTWISDLNGTMIKANAALAKTLNIPLEKLVGKYNGFQDPQLEPHIIEAHRNALEKGISTDIEVDWVGAGTEQEEYLEGNRVFCEGVMFPILNQQGEITNAVITYKDVTESKRNEDALSSKRLQLGNVLEATNAGAWNWNVQTGEMIVNERWASILGYSLEELSPITGDVAKNLICPEDLPTAEKAISDHFQGVKSYYDVELRQQHKDGSLVWVNARGKVIEHSENGEPLWMMGTHLDITQRKIAEEKLKIAFQDLESKNSDLDAFSYTVAHDLKAPLRHITSFAALLKDDYRENLAEGGLELLSLIVNSTEKMNALVDSLLSFSRADQGELKFKKLNLSTMATEIGNKLKQTYQDRQVQMLIDENIEPVGDQGLLNVVLVNLIGNAWKFTGNVEKAVIEFRQEEANGEQVYSIIDNGDGFDMNFKHDLFAPFKRLHTEEKFQGSGIGLATVKRIINRHGGNIWAEGKPGKGATFYFTLGEIN